MLVTKAVNRFIKKHIKSHFAEEPGKERDSVKCDIDIELLHETL